MDIIRIYESEIIDDINFENNINNYFDKTGVIICSDKKNGLIVKCGNNILNNKNTFLKINKLSSQENISNPIDLLNSEKYQNILKPGNIFL